MTDDYPFLKACRGEKPEYTPVWIMRQAGRYLPQYQEVRAKVDFLTLCKTPELAAEVTIQPIDILGVDAAILFSDILIPIEAMGMKLDFTDVGPRFDNPIQNKADIDALRIPNTEESMPFVLDTIKLLRRALDGRVPVIGFSGAPWTLLTYMVEGGSSKNFTKSKTLMYQNPELAHALLSKITDTVIDYLTAQVKAGAHVVQLFESWGGILAPKDYNEYIFPYTQRIVSTIQHLGVPVIYYLNGVAGLLEKIADVHSDVVGIDWRISLRDAIRRLGPNRVVQGNIDPLWLFMPVEKIRERTREVIEEGKAAKAHIFNLGHGILPPTPVESAKALVDAVHEYSRV